MTIDNKFSARQQNLQAILNLLDKYDRLSAKELSNYTGLSIVSINKLLEVLITSSNIIAIDYLNTRGRRAKIYRLNYDTIDLGIVQLEEINNKIQATYSLTDLSGKILLKKSNNAAITSISQLTKFISQETNKHKPEKIIIGVPGAELNGYLQLSDVESLRGINLSLAIRTATNVETIVVNDANATTFGAATELNQSGNTAVGLYFPKNSGPGVGIVINNQLINGADGLAGEIEYSTVDIHNSPSQQIISHIQNIISFLNPHLILVYADKLALTDLQIDQIKQTVHRNLPLHEKYKLDFDRNFESDYLTGLTTIGRKNILKNIIVN